MSNMYTIISNDEILTNEKLDEIKTKYDGINYDLINIDMSDGSVISLLNELMTIPFLYEYKMVIIKNPNFIADYTKYDEVVINSFMRYIKSPNEQTISIFVFEKEIKNGIMALLKENGYYYTLNKITDENLIDIVKKTFSKDEYSISKRALDELINRVNSDKMRVFQEIEKLKLYKSYDKNIDVEDVTLMVSRDLEDNVFELVNAICQNNKLKALDIYHDLLTINVDPTKMIATIIAKYNELYQTKSLIDIGMKKDEIALTLNVSSGRAYYMIMNASSANMKNIKKSVNTLLDLDYQIKKGTIDKFVGLESFLLSL